MFFNLNLLFVIGSPSVLTTRRKFPRGNRWASENVVMAGKWNRRKGEAWFIYLQLAQVLPFVTILAYSTCLFCVTDSNRFTFVPFWQTGCVRNSALPTSTAASSGDPTWNSKEDFRLFIWALPSLYLSTFGGGGGSANCGRGRTGSWTVNTPG